MTERLTAFQEVQGRIQALQSQIDHARQDLGHVMEQEEKILANIEHLELLQAEWRDLSAAYFIGVTTTGGFRPQTDQISGPAPRPVYPVGEAAR